MPIIADTTLWSLALRRHPSTLSADEAALVLELDKLSVRGELYVVGVVRQELLSGLRGRKQFDAVTTRFARLQHLLAKRQDHDRAAEFYNRCLDRGIAATHFDMLICSLAAVAPAPIFTTDADFPRYATCLPIRLYSPPPP